MHQTARTAGVLAAALVLASGSAYAGQVVGRNSVGSPQVKDNSLLGKDIKGETIRSGDVRNGTLTQNDLRPGAAPVVYHYDDVVPADSVQRTVVSIPGFSEFKITCSASSHNLFIGFGPGSPIPPGTPQQRHGLIGSDRADNSPVGGATITGTGGGVGFGNPGGSPPGSGILTTGDYFGRSTDLVAHGTWTLAFPSAGGCLTRIRVTVHRLATPAPLARTLSGSERAVSTCEASGAAYCRSS